MRTWGSPLVKWAQASWRSMPHGPSAVTVAQLPAGADGPTHSPLATTAPGAWGDRREAELPASLEVLTEREADGGATRKGLLRVGDRHVVEAVLMEYRDRMTACVSSQAGCAMGCGFCATGQMGLLNNLTAGEHAYTVVWAVRAERLARP